MLLVKGNTHFQPCTFWSGSRNNIKLFMMPMRHVGSHHIKLLPFARICHILCIQKNASVLSLLCISFPKDMYIYKKKKHCIALFSGKPIYILQEYFLSPTAVFINQITLCPWMLTVAFTEREECKMNAKKCLWALKCSTNLSVYLHKKSTLNSFIILEDRECNFLSSVALCCICMW